MCISVPSGRRVLLMSGYLYFLNNLKDKRPYIGLYDKLKNLQDNGNSFQRKTELIATPYILQ